jgi:hypothetical protein
MGIFTPQSVFPIFPFPFEPNETRCAEEVAIILLVADVVGGSILIGWVRDTQDRGPAELATDSPEESLQHALDIVVAHRRECGDVLTPLLASFRALWPVNEVVSAGGKPYGSGVEAILGMAERTEMCLRVALCALQLRPPRPVDDGLHDRPDSEEVDRLHVLAKKEIALVTQAVSRPVVAGEVAEWEQLLAANLERETAMPDGPQPPHWLWWKGKRHRLTPQQHQLLTFLWPHAEVQVERVERAVWGDEGAIVTESTLRSALSKLNGQLQVISIPWQYYLRRGKIIRE